MNLIQRQTQSGLKFLLTGFVAIFAVCICSVAIAADPLASWNEGPARKAILEFVAAVTDENGKDYVAPAERIATFDNDGTLWVEYPMYMQVLFAFERVKELAPQHPEWKTTQPFKALLEGDMKTVGASGKGADLRAEGREQPSEKPISRTFGQVLLRPATRHGLLGAAT